MALLEMVEVSNVYHEANQVTNFLTKIGMDQIDSVLVYDVIPNVYFSLRVIDRILLDSA